ncbi:15063_t:CDS:2, partial [Dentiscutata heterogama]
SSYKRMINLQLVEQTIDDSNLVLRIINTRWLSLSNVVTNLHRILNSVKIVLKEDSSKNIVVQGLYNAMDQTFYLATKLLADILYNLRSLTNLFQADYITISEIYTHLNATIDIITTQYIGHNGIPPNYRNFLREYIDKQNILIKDLPDFILQFAFATIESLQDRFPDSEILNSLRIFDPQELLLQYNQIHSY